MQLSDYEGKAIFKLCETIEDGKWSNGALVQLIEQAGAYLNLSTIPDYAKRNKLSYNGVKKTRKITKIFGVKFVIEN
jgi:hypothetical protein